MFHFPVKSFIKGDLKFYTFRENFALIKYHVNKQKLMYGPFVLIDDL